MNEIKEDIIIDDDISFKRGVEDAAYFAGFLSVFYKMGIDMELVFGLLEKKISMEQELKIVDINRELSILISDKNYQNNIDI